MPSMTAHLPPAEWTRNAHDGIDARTVHGAFREIAAKHPQRIALSWLGGELTYAELDRKSDALAHELLALGAQPEERIALCLPRSPEAVLAALAVLKAACS